MIVIPTCKQQGLSGTGQEWKEVHIVVSGILHTTVIDLGSDIVDFNL